MDNGVTPADPFPYQIDVDAPSSILLNEDLVILGPECSQTFAVDVSIAFKELGLSIGVRCKHADDLSNLDRFLCNRQ